MRRHIASLRGKEGLVGSGPVRPSIIALSFGVTVAHCSLGDEAAVKSGVGCELGVELVYVIGAAELGFDMKLLCELNEEIRGASGRWRDIYIQETVRMA